MSETTEQGVRLGARFWRRVQPAVVLFSAVFCSSLLGIITRQLDWLAVFWIANALLLGLLLRYPFLATASGWLAAVAGYIAADLLTGSGWHKALWLTAGNMAGVVVGYALFVRYLRRRMSLKHSDSMLFLITFTLAAAGTAGLIGMVINPLLFEGAWQEGFRHWFVAEWFSYLAILPVILTLPHRRRSRPRVVRSRPLVRRLLPLLALVASLAAAILLGGPGAVAYAVPALLWCALSYSVFQTALVTLAFCVLSLGAIYSGWMDLGVALDAPSAMASLRLGILLIALGPLTVSNVMSARNDLQRRLRHLATHDSLTQMLNRGGFMEQATQRLADIPTLQPLSVSLLMLDIDHFKRINDTRGHGGGDQVLAVFAETVKDCLREHDLLARLGGEEFAVLLPESDGYRAQRVAERIRAAVEAKPVQLVDQEPLQVTVSIGIAVAEAERAEINSLLSIADTALYQAKRGGRNRVVLAATTASQ